MPFTVLWSATCHVCKPQNQITFNSIVFTLITTNCGNFKIREKKNTTRTGSHFPRPHNAENEISLNSNLKLVHSDQTAIITGFQSLSTNRRGTFVYTYIYEEREESWKKPGEKIQFNWSSSAAEEMPARNVKEGKKCRHTAPSSSSSPLSSHLYRNCLHFSLLRSPTFSI